jgi:8-oxo-dGTP diphosphatase
MHILMPIFLIRQFSGEPRGVEGQQLAWVSSEELGSYELTPADKPLVPQLAAALVSSQD